MSATPANTRVNIISCLRYRDAPAAIDWLGRAFGFEKQAVYPDDNNGIAHAQLTFGNGMIMLASADSKDTEYSRLMKLPDDIGGAQTQTLYMVVADADAAYAMAREAGAKIIIDIKDEDYGGRGFTCRDLENYVWSFGTYDPYA
ncbi:MAG: VOC family protein [Massilia sp.]|nr:VOC family protein [Massilia sp.]